MSTETMGAIYAALTALAWAASVIFFQRAGEVWPAFALNVWKNLAALVAFGVTLVVAQRELWPAPEALDLVVLLASGALGIGIADTLFLRCLNRIGAGRTAIVETAYAPSVVVASFFLLGERLSARHGLGALLVLAGVVLVVRRAPEGEAEGAVARRDVVHGIASGLAAMAIVAVAIVGAKPVLARYDVLWSTTVRMVGGLAVLVFALLVRPGLRGPVRATLRPQAAWRFALPGALIGSYLSMLLWVAGFKYADAGVAALLNQTSSVLVVLLAAIFLREPLSVRKVAAVALAGCGALLITL